MKNKAIGICILILVATALLAFIVVERNGDFLAESLGRIGIGELQAALSANDVELGSEDTTRKYFKLNGANARTFELVNGERISFYIFRSDMARVKGEKDFEKERAKYDMQIPEAYTAHNVLIHYWYQGENGSVTEYGERIDRAVQMLLKEGRGQND